MLFPRSPQCAFCISPANHLSDPLPGPQKVSDPYIKVKIAKLSFKAHCMLIRKLLKRKTDLWHSQYYILPIFWQSRKTKWPDGRPVYSEYFQKYWTWAFSFVCSLFVSPKVLEWVCDELCTTILRFWSYWWGVSDALGIGGPNVEVEPPFLASVFLAWQAALCLLATLHALPPPQKKSFFLDTLPNTGEG